MQPLEVHNNRNKPLMSDDLKMEIATQVHAIDANTCKRVFGNTIKRFAKFFCTINKMLIKF